MTWINLDEQEPAEGQRVIVLFWPYNNRDNHQIAESAVYRDGSFLEEIDGNEMHPASHWMPFPELTYHPA